MMEIQGPSGVQVAAQELMILPNVGDLVSAAGPMVTEQCIVRTLNKIFLLLEEPSRKLEWETIQS